ncbi:G patch domain and ankyrin repeat-containing protein 1 homolog [Styela clava]
MGVNGWQNRLDLLINPVEFVTETGSDDTEGAKKLKESSKCSLTGDEAKKLYEDIINEPLVKVKKKSIAKHRCKKERKEKQLVHLNDQVEQLTVNDMFKAAQCGDIKSVKACILKHKLDINATDQYSWTPLMMAAHEGHMHVVTFLLTEGANWKDKVDASGYDARDLACLGGHGDTAHIFTNSRMYIQKIKVERCREKVLKTIKREKLWCEVCKCHYYATDGETEHSSHNSSTLHLFNDKDSSQPHSSHFYISVANKGYQLMQRDGWDGESGLGPGGSGTKYPVKTVLKRDRLGFGAENSEAKSKVTHFGANDKNAVKRHHEEMNKKKHKGTSFNSKTKRKKDMSRRQALEKEKEVNFRRLFH